MTAIPAAATTAATAAVRSLAGQNPAEQNPAGQSFDGKILTGRIVDAKTGEPIAGAVVAAADADGKPAGYTTSAADGRFGVKLREGRKIVRLECSMLGYRRQSAEAEAAADRPVEIRMQPEAFAIREVSIRAPRLTLRGDTVSYRVDGFTEAQDRSIADVLRKMPGIEVAKSGEIRYNGDPISKFYIEGMDMLDGRYGSATNNIAPQDVASVEVLENHQPIKALENVVFSDRAAINLRLKEHARAHRTGRLSGAAGWSPALWNAQAFTMRIGSGSQSMVNLRTDDTGQRPTADLQRHTTEELLHGDDTGFETPRWFRPAVPAAPLDERRTRFNRSHAASADNLWKLSDNYLLNSHIAFGYDRTTSESAARIIRYLPDSELEETRSERTRLRSRELAAEVRLVANTERFYLADRLTADLAENDYLSDVGGSYPNRQECATPAYRVENTLDYIRRAGNRTLTVTSHLLGLAQPQQLAVLRDGDEARQQLDANLLRMNHAAAWSVPAGRRLTFRFKGGVAALFRSFANSLTGIGTEQEPEQGQPQSGRSSFGHAEVYFHPSATFRTSKLRLELALPAEYCHYRLDGQRDDAAIWSSRLSARWNPSARWTLTASGQIGTAPPDDTEIYPGTILRDYRTLTTGSLSFAPTRRRIVSLGANYRNPLDGLFLHLSATRFRNVSPLLAERRFEGAYIVDGWLARTNPAAAWQLSGGIGKSIDALHGQAGIDAGYRLSDLQMMQEGQLMPYRNTTLTLSPHINLRPARWFNFEYALNCSDTRLRIAGAAASRQQSLDQRLQLNFTPAETVILRLTGEHYCSRRTAATTEHLVLADIECRWKAGRQWEFTASAANLFDRRAYIHTLFDGLNMTTCRYAIRPRNILLGASRSF